MTIDAIITHGCPPEAITGRGPVLKLDGTPPAEWGPRARSFLDQHIKYNKQRSIVLLEGDADETSPEEWSLLHACQLHYTRTRVHQATIETFAKQWGLNFVRALRRGPRWATSIGQPLAGLPAFVVSAGPSLDRNGALLREAQKRGPIIAVNTSVSACLHHGVLPDLVVACEAINLADHLAPLKGTNTPVVIDMTASSANWDVAENPWAVAKMEPCNVRYVLQAGGLPLAYTGSVSCAAAALALYWGASPVVLLGQDCAYTGGKYYAQGTPYADLTTEVVGEPGNEFVLVHGRSKEQSPQSVLWQPAWGGEGQVPSDHAMAVFVDWFKTAATQHQIVNATEGGCRIEYSYELPLARVLDGMQPVTRAPLPTPAKVDTAGLCARMLMTAHEVLHYPGITVPPPDLQLLTLWMAAMAFDRGGTPRERRLRRRELIEQGCMEIVEALT